MLSAPVVLTKSVIVLLNQVAMVTITVSKVVSHFCCRPGLGLVPLFQLCPWRPGFRWLVGFWGEGGRG